MKRITVILFFLATIFQASTAQNRLGLIGGGIYSESNLKNQGQNLPTRFVWNVEFGHWEVAGNASRNKISYNGKFSVYGGLVYDVKITNAFSIKTKLLFVPKGWIEKSEYREDSVFSMSFDRDSTILPSHTNIPDELTKSKHTYSLGYVELPVTFTFYAPIRKSLVFIAIGPYVAYGLLGKYRYRVTESNKQVRLDSTENLKISFDANSTKDLNARRIDYGAAVEVGVELRNRMFVIINYTAGLSDVFEKQYWALPNRNRDIRIGIGYYLKQKQQYNY